MGRHFMAWASLALLSALARGEVCAECRDDDLIPDFSFLQVNQNITRSNGSNSSLARTLAGASPSVVVATPPAGPSEVMSLTFTKSSVHSETTNAGTVLLDLVILVLMLILMGLCCSRFILVSTPDQASRGPSPGSPSKAKDPNAAAALLSSQAVPIPVLCPEFVMKASESRFTIDMAHITGPVQSFPINLPSGKKVLEATSQQGGMITITDVEQQARRMMIRASSSGGRPLLTIYDGSGAFFGKVSADGNGVVLYSMQSPCALMKTTDVAGCSVEFQTLKEPRAIIARTFKKGEELRAQVSADYDGILLMGCVLGVILLQPEMMKMGL
ncbi:unnamed protein product [Symbiodinium natans]|uniref:Altered inheritance of mitochondria protein 24, mitochondrial n=1 Tax=Symbiodinium natans TaxID=878477 RepID=A0A812HV97_9DINO|nr:unnamed protein product [Symbiodinium natans]